MLNIIKSQQEKGKKYYSDKKLKKQTKEKLKKDFFNMCYLCESRDMRNFQIEHFEPQKIFPDKIDDWNNLFLICGKCNTVRPKDINSTDEKLVYNNCIDNVENLIELRYENKQINIKTKKNTTKAKNTANLLERIYNGKGSESDDYRELQEDIKNKIGYFEKAIDKFENIKNKKLKKNYKKIIIEFISKDYNLNMKVDSNRVGFVSFKRQIIKDKIINKQKRYKKLEKFKQYFI